MYFFMDKNLGFVVDDLNWKAFFKKYQIQVVEYTDIKQMALELDQNKASIAYLPSAAYFYMKSNQFKPIANALFASNQACQISSLLVVSKESGIDNLSQLKHKRYGCINFDCTSSYFAPAILLWKNHYSFKDFFSSIQEVGAWQLQIDAVMKDVIDATMVQEDVWHQLPINAQKTRVIAQVDHLPSPLIIVDKSIDPSLEEDLKELLLQNKQTPAPNALFNGFVPFQEELVERFYADARAAFK